MHAPRLRLRLVLRPAPRGGEGGPLAEEEQELGDDLVGVDRGGVDGEIGLAFLRGDQRTLCVVVALGQLLELIGE